MTKEELIGLGAAEDLALKILDKYTNMIPKARLDEVISERNELKKQVEGLGAYETKIKDLEQANLNYQEKLNNWKLHNMIEKNGALNSKAVAALVDFSKISFNDDEIIGLTEQLEELKKNESYLFKKEQEERVLQPEGIKPTVANTEVPTQKMTLSQALTNFYKK